MADVGATTRKASLTQKLSSEAHSSLDREPMDDDYDGQVISTKAPHLSNETEKLKAYVTTQSLIDKHFNSLLEPLGNDLDSDQKLQAILDD